MGTFLERPEHIFIMLVALLGLALSVGAFSTVRITEKHKVRDHFDQIARDRANALEHGIHRFSGMVLADADTYLTNPPPH